MYCTDFDIQLKKDLNHLENHSQMLPFFGKSWILQKNKILFIAESHYLPVDSDGKSSNQTWYDLKSSSLNADEKDWTHTRGITLSADKYAVDKANYAKGHTIFYNIKAAIFEALEVKNKSQRLFQNFGYYNYFQRPAEETGKSIINLGVDNRIAYNTLKSIAENAKPTFIIFVSKKAYNSFCYWRKQQQDEVFLNLPVYHVPHPASAWWNKPSKAYGNIAGKTKLIKLIKDLNLELIGISN